MDFPDGPFEAAVDRFPIIFKLGRDSELMVSMDRSHAIPAGTRVLSIDGVSAERYVRTTLKCFGAQNEVLRRIRFTHGSPWASIAVLGSRERYDITWISSSGQRNVSTLRPLQRLALPKRRPAYSFSIIDRGRIGYIDYRRCENRSAFEVFLKSTRSQLKAERISALVIDIRKNFGGNSSLNDLLWTYVSNKPFTQSGPETVRSSRLLKQSLGRVAYLQTYGAAAWHASDGVLVTIESSMVEPDAVPNRYTGPVYLLISEETFSSGMMCAIAAKDYGLATVVGSQTAEPVDTTGEVFGFTTHRLRFQVGIPTAIERGPKKTKRGSGVVPDIEIAMPIDTIAGRDHVLEKTIELIRDRHA